MRACFIKPNEIGVQVFALNLLEAFLHCRLNPKFEGYKSQR